MSSKDPANWPPRVIFNSDGNWLYRYLKNHDPADVTGALPVLREAGMDALSILIGVDDGPAWLDSKFARPWGEDCPDWDPDGDPSAHSVGGGTMADVAVINKTIHEIVEDGHDLMKLYIESARKHGAGIFASFRMNDAHVCYEDRGWYGRSREKLDHPELLIGSPVPEHAHGADFGFNWQWNYAEPRVRERFLGLVDETLERYDFDGVELDFCRQPPFFKPAEAQENIPKMTDFMRKAAETVEKHRKARDRNLKLIVRVPPCIKESLVIGIDTLTWLREALADVLILGSANLTTPRTDTARAVEAAGGRVLIYTGLEGSTRKASPQDGFEANQPGIHRAVADNGYRQGASGVQIFNNDIASHQTRLAIGRPAEKPKVNITDFDYPEVNRRLLMALGDPEALGNSDRCYCAVDACSGPYPPSYTSGDFRPQVPRKLSLVGRGANRFHTVYIPVEDDVDGGLKEGRIKKTELRLRLVDYENCLDRIICEVNGQRLELDPEKSVSNRLGETWMIVDNPPLKKGENAFLIVLEGIRTPDPWPELKQIEVRLICRHES